MSPSGFAIIAVAFKICHRHRRLQALPFPSRSTITIVAFKICYHCRLLQALPSPLSPVRSGITTIAFKLCHRRCHLQALQLPLSFATKWDSRDGRERQDDHPRSGRKQQGEEWREKKGRGSETDWAAWLREGEEWCCSLNEQLVLYITTNYS